MDTDREFNLLFVSDRTILGAFEIFEGLLKSVKCRLKVVPMRAEELANDKDAGSKFKSAKRWKISTAIHRNDSSMNLLICLALVYFANVNGVHVR